MTKSLLNLVSEELLFLKNKSRRCLFCKRMKKEKSYFHATCITSMALKVVVMHPVSCVMNRVVFYSNCCCFSDLRFY